MRIDPDYEGPVVEKIKRKQKQFCENGEMYPSKSVVKKHGNDFYLCSICGKWHVV